MQMTIAELSSEAWLDGIDGLRALLGAPDNPRLFTPHFLKASFPKIGGRIFTLTEGQVVRAVAFAFPRVVGTGHQVGYTFRVHAADPAHPVNVRAFADEASAACNGAVMVPYDPDGSHTFHSSVVHQDGALVFATPGVPDAPAVRRLHQHVWGSAPDDLYPADMHSDEFQLGTSLVARHGVDVVAFLFGFYKFKQPLLPQAWRERYSDGLYVESQVMGVHPFFRRHRAGFLLKKAQAEDALRRGIRLINWVVDPLQFGNALLNFGLLKSISFECYPNYYTFRNELNHLPASRFVITWLLDSWRVQEALTRTGAPTVLDLSRVQTSVGWANDGFADVHLDLSDRLIAIEVPPEWTSLQRTLPDDAAHWRVATDRIFARYLGPQLGQYVLTSVGERDSRKYLIAERVDHELLEQFGLPRTSAA